MRKMKKDSILEIANLLQKAQEHVKNLLLQQEYASVLDLLQQCQQGAIQIGTIIEQSEGEGFPTVKMLEEYCELVFQVFEMVQSCVEKADQVAPDADVIFGAMDRLLAEVGNSIRKDIKNRKEVVFLPYKASMWDSLESIWMAADADPECDAYVVPIPYFDKNPNGTAKEMHYEGNLFPEYVPVTHYDHYNIEERHPDAIYIHNPYDETNFVTSVHPAFYSKRLKELTDCLVYIPYFVLTEINPEDKAAVKGIEHFVTVPGVIHAHKVVVQSEAMRQVYIDVMTGLTGKDTKYYWEQKILGIGSPKLDKVHNTKKEEVKVPTEWLKIIEKPDGQWKKIIFYNTSVSALLKNREKMLDKMRDVFEIFKENREEVALLWRPHPLIKATIESMCPQLWEDYRKLVEEYKAEGWGIYDDTPDMDRAVALCDGYYGDGSSVVHLCREAGKPVMLQEVKYVKREDHMQNSRMVPVKMEDAEVENGRVWFFAYDYNGLYSKDLISGEVQSLGAVSGEKISQMRLYSSLKKVGNKIFLIPNEAKELAVFEIETGTYKKLDISKQVRCDERIKYMAAASYEDKLYIFGLNKPVIIEVNADTCEVERTLDLRKTIGDAKDIYFRKQFIERNGKLYVPFCLEGKMLELDCKTMQIKIHCIENKAQGYAGISSEDGETFWFSPMYDSGDVIKWHRNKGVIERIPAKNVHKEFSYVGINKIGKIQVMFPAEKAECAGREWPEDIAIAEGNYTFAKKCEDRVIAYETNKDCVCCWDKDGKKEETEALAPIEYTQEKQLMYADGAREKRGASLDYLIEILDEDCERLEREMQKLSVGENIYQTLH